MKKKEVLDIVFRVSVVLFANILLAFSTVFFLEPANLYSGGATGLAQFIRRLIVKIAGREISMSLAWFIFLVNVPITLIGFKFVSKKFAIYSVAAILVQTLAVFFIEMIPMPDFITKMATPIALADGTTMANYGGLLTLAIFGGLLGGISAGIALRYGTSTGGIDVVSQALEIHKNISIGNFTMAFNVALAILGGGVMQGDWSIVLFTIVRMILQSLVVDKVHTGYSYTELRIFSDRSKEIGEAILYSLHRGCTYMNATGAYTNSPKPEVLCVVLTFEVETIFKLAKEIDPNVFMTASPVKKVRGKFNKKSII